MKLFLYNLATDKYKGLGSRAIKFFLFLISVIYAVVIKILVFFYGLKPYRLNCKVISVGNITLGGTGKTSLVAYIARYLKQQGHKIAVISRGYKRKVTSYPTHAMAWVPRVTSYENMGDEPYMLQKKLEGIPVVVDENRIRAGNLAISDYGADTVILDDGFQQWKIVKDLEIVTIDATNPFGNRCLIPRGILREGLSALERADVFVLTKTNLNKDVEKIKETLIKFNPRAIIIESAHREVSFYNLARPQEIFSIDALKGKTTVLFSGIGDPQSFEDLILGLGIKIGLFFRFPDHHSYTQEDLDRIIHASKKKNIDTIITTEKDAVRISDLRPATGEVHLLALRIQIEIKDEERFYNRLHQLYSA